MFIRLLCRKVVEKATPLMIEGEGGVDAAAPLFYGQFEPTVVSVSIGIITYVTVLKVKICGVKRHKLVLDNN